MININQEKGLHQVNLIDDRYFDSYVNALGVFVALLKEMIKM